jgi:hypothetical protein
MIFERPIDATYKPWFAWRPVQLRGPDEWDRCKKLGTTARWVWLRFVWRRRCIPNTYYTIDDE